MAKRNEFVHQKEAATAALLPSCDRGGHGCGPPLWEGVPAMETIARIRGESLRALQDINKQTNARILHSGLPPRVQLKVTAASTPSPARSGRARNKTMANR